MMRSIGSISFDSVRCFCWAQSKSEVSFIELPCRLFPSTPDGALGPAAEINTLPKTMCQQYGIQKIEQIATKRWLLTFLFVVAMFFKLTLPAHSQNLDCTLSGIVKTPQGRPISGAKVVLSGPIGQSQSMQTGSEGTYNFIAIPGYYTIEIQSRGYVGGSHGVPLFESNDGHCNQTLNATLSPVLRSTPKVMPHARVLDAQGGQVNLDHITIDVNNSVDSYCKHAAQIACSLYTEHAYGCVSTAIEADKDYRVVLFLEKQGISATQASGDSAIKSAAADMISGMTMKQAANPKWPDIFARTVILPLCLDSGK